MKKPKLSEGNKLRLVYFLVFCCTAAWLPILAEHLARKGLSGLQIGIVLSTTPAMMFAIQPFYGSLADRFGYRKMLLISSLLAAISYLLFLFADTFSALFVSAIFMSLFYNAIQPILDSLSLRLAARDSSFSYGTLRIAGAVGWAFTGIITGYFIDHLDTSVIFIISAISMFLAFLSALLLTPDKSVNPQAELPDTPSKKRSRGGLFSPTLLFLLSCVFLVSVGATAIWNFYSIYMKENGATASLVGYGISFQGLCELPLFYFSARIIRYLGIRRTLLLTVLATTVRLVLYGLVSNPKAAIAIEMLHGFSWSLFWVVCVEYVNTLVRQEWRVTGQSLLYAAYYGAGQIAGNFWTGALYDHKLKIAQIFLLNAAIVAGVGLLIAVVMKKPQRAAAPG